MEVPCKLVTVTMLVTVTTGCAVNDVLVLLGTSIAEPPVIQEAAYDIAAALLHSGLAM
jgi:hypothetical protein